MSSSGKQFRTFTHLYIALFILWPLRCKNSLRIPDTSPLPDTRFEKIFSYPAVVFTFSVVSLEALQLEVFITSNLPVFFYVVLLLVRSVS